MVGVGERKETVLSLLFRDPLKIDVKLSNQSCVLIFVIGRGVQIVFRDVVEKSPCMHSKKRQYFGLQFVPRLCEFSSAPFFRDSDSKNGASLGSNNAATVNFKGISGKRGENRLSIC